MTMKKDIIIYKKGGGYLRGKGKHLKSHNNRYGKVLE